MWIHFKKKKILNAICSNSKGWKTVGMAGDVSLWVMRSCMGLVFPPSSMTRNPPQPPGQTLLHLSISSQYSVTWNHGAKKLNQLLRLLNESNFLPESTKRAHISIATLNYLTLIQINKRHHHQDCATPRWQTVTTLLYNRMKTAMHCSHWYAESIISFKTDYNRNKSIGAWLVLMPSDYELYTICYENIHIIDSALWHPLIPVFH